MKKLLLIILSLIFTLSLIAKDRPRDLGIEIGVFKTGK